MLVTLKEILKIAEDRKCAIGSFNTPNLESLIAVIKAAEELEQPVIIMHAEIHEELMPIDIIGPVMIDMAEKSKVPVCVHLDHGVSLSYVKHSIELGFTSVMYDGSVLTFEENVKNTKDIVAYAHNKGVSVEAEIGVLGKRELGAGHEDENDINAPVEVYTDPVDAKRFVKDTDIDALACSFGTAHGIYLKKPKLDFSVLEKVKEVIDIPLVMHGGSGVSEDEYKKVINKGVRKINYYTYMAKAGGEAVQKSLKENNDSIVYFHDIVSTAINAMKENVKSAISVFSMI